MPHPFYPGYVPSFDPPEPDYLRWDEPVDEEIPALLESFDWWLVDEAAFQETNEQVRS